MYIRVMQLDVEMGQLRAFAVLGEELHFGNAAALLRVAQPALSQQIRRLEQRLGFRLFDRTSRKVDLTPAGAAFLASVRKVFIDLERAVETGHDLASGKVGTVTVGYVATAMMTVLPPIVRKFHEGHRDVRVLLRELASVPQIDGLRRGDLDVAILTGSIDDEAIAHFQIWRDPLVALLPAGHSGARKSSVSASALAADQLITFPRLQTPALYDQILSLCRNSGFEPTLGQEAQSWHMIAELVSAGMGVSIVPLSVRRYRVAGVRYVPLRPGGSVSTLMCYNRPGTSTATKLFIDTAKQLFYKS
jgi:DNA-binding transcriptional LysR family regulator